MEATAVNLKGLLDISICNVSLCYCIICMWRKTFSVPKAEVEDFFLSELHCDVGIMSNIVLGVQPNTHFQVKTWYVHFSIVLVSQAFPTAFDCWAGDW
jgi:hypothetical protein